MVVLILGYAFLHLSIVIFIILKKKSNFPEDQDDETLTIRGSDVDYVRANIHCATSIGRARRKEVEAAQEAAAEKRKKKSEQMKPSEKYKTGSVPKVRNKYFLMNLNES